MQGHQVAAETQCIPQLLPRCAFVSAVHDPAALISWPSVPRKLPRSSCQLALTIVRLAAHMPQLTEEGGIVLFHCCHNGLPLVSLLLGVDPRGVGESVTCRARLQSNSDCCRTGSTKPAHTNACRQNRLQHGQAAVQTAGAKVAAGACKQRRLAMQALWCSCRGVGCSQVMSICMHAAKPQVCTSWSMRLRQTHHFQLMAGVAAHL